MAYAGIIVGLLLIFAGIWLFAMSLFFYGLGNGLLEAVRFGFPCIVIGIAILGFSYYSVRKR